MRAVTQLAFKRMLEFGAILNGATILLSIFEYGWQIPLEMGFITGACVFAALMLGFFQTFLDHLKLNRNDPRGHLLNWLSYAYLFYAAVALIALFVSAYATTLWGAFWVFLGMFIFRILMNILSAKSLGGSAFLW